MAACGSTQAIDPRPIAFKRKSEAGDQAPAAELDFPDEGSGATDRTALQAPFPTQAGGCHSHSFGFASAPLETKPEIQPVREHNRL